MPAKIDLTGKKFNRLTVVKQVTSAKVGVLRWLCRCDCGNTKEVRGCNLTSGQVQSCGCLQKQRTAKANTTHGLSGSPEYRVWEEMLRRCNCRSDTCYSYYGGRGIGVCDRWNVFDNFYSDMGARPSNKYSIERKDNNKGYSPDNCCWATITQQCNNTRKNIFLTHKGITMTISQWARELGISYTCLYQRVSAGWPIEKSLSTPNTRQVSHIK